MNPPQRPLWRRILFYRITEIDRVLWNWFRQRDHRLVDAARGFDLGWMRWLLSLCALTTAANLLPFHPALQWTALLGTWAFAVLLCLYFAWLLFRRLQCSLLEWMLLIAFLGNAEGLLLTTPRFASLDPLAWALAPLACAWVLYGMVTALVQARLLGLESPGLRLLLLAGNWLALAAPALLLAGGLLYFGGLSRWIAGPGMLAWSGPLMWAGLLGLCVAILLARKVSRAARVVLGL